MNVELERIGKGAVVPQSRYCPYICLEGLRKTSVPAGIRTKPLLNTSLESYRYTSLLAGNNFRTQIGI
jgi:hypothetical protein